MRNCKLTIVTNSGSVSSTFQADAVWQELQEGERICYQIEGDEGEIVFSENSMAMSRRGNCSLRATFLEGQESEMIISDSSLLGSIPVRTTKYHLHRQDDQRTIELSYELFAAENIQTYSLKILLFFSEEK